MVHLLGLAALGRRLERVHAEAAAGLVEHLAPDDLVGNRQVLEGLEEKHHVGHQEGHTSSEVRHKEDSQMRREVHLEDHREDHRAAHQGRNLFRMGGIHMEAHFRRREEVGNSEVQENHAAAADSREVAEGGLTVCRR